MNKVILKVLLHALLFLVLLQTREAEPCIHTELGASIRVHSKPVRPCHPSPSLHYDSVFFLYSFFFLLELYNVEKKSSVNVWFFSIMFFFKKKKKKNH